ncbi:MULTISPECIES: NUDIX hydrolase [unclassified Mycobacterium]|uniref:NUDIX hydrolase n=1 Tax=unclassified Mycobacterium TaxID=2642494 RepID=UPI0008010E22|nr:MULTISPECIES: NUDIX domain-containing protein [unclassified Mycobacterium]OBG57333.1 exopolyphosphatase [Mycobacterium sp. E188]OBH44526.1 exopolyphosphatase [Mycobacterium sp. E183]
MTWLAVAVAVLVGLLAVLGAWAYQTANRLDRLHVRYDLSWQALDGALARRAVVARAVAIDAYGGASEGRRLAALADAAEAAPRQERESRENELSAALAIVDPASLPAGLIAESADAEARVLLARRFHNDAVRDTLALRERFLVRTLRLGGTAALPSYFEIVERPHALAHGDVGSFNGVVSHRTSARVVLLDETGAVLLLRGSDPAIGRGSAPKWWITVGGEVQRGERLAEAAARELAEETGLRAAPGELVGPVWRRDEVFEFNGSLIDSEEFYFVYRTHRFEPSGAGRTDLERSYIHGHRWCDAADIARLAAAGETVYPRQLGELLVDAAALAGGRAPGPLVSIR